MADTSKAVLLVADISGYTRFMKHHAISVNHAKQIIVRLLKSLMQVSTPPLKVAELEGDAVFFYALSSDKDLQKTVQHVKGQMVKFFSAFNNELTRINELKTCQCDACDNAHDLKLKQVVHVGEVAVEKIAQFEKLFGFDVIVVHRMLKNSVPSKEYVMMTDPVFSRIDGFYGLEPERRTESFEGVGDVETLVFYPAGLGMTGNDTAVRKEPSSWWGKMVWRGQITWITLLDYFGLKKVKGVFNNLPA